MEKPKVNDLHSDGLNILEDVIDDIPNKDETSMYKRKDPHSDGMDDSPGDEIEEKELDKMLAHLDNEYTKKSKLGSQVSKLIHKNGYHPDSLTPEYKEALDLHLKKRVASFPENIEFKPWQLSILEEVDLTYPQKEK